MSKPMSDERLEEVDLLAIEQLVRELRAKEIPHAILPYLTVEKLVRIARVRRCEAAECEAWRAAHPDMLRIEDDNPRADHKRTRHLIVPAMRATDAARREMEGR